MFKFINLVFGILWDQRGEDLVPNADPNTDPNTDPAADPNVDPNADPNIDPNADLNADPNAGKPAFGDFGDTPKTLEEATALLQKIYGEHSKIKPEFETLRGKTTATERNLALTRQALESSGIKAVQDENGNIHLEVVNKPQERKTRFQDTHKSLFEPKVLEALELWFEDKFDNGWQSRQQQYQEARQKVTIFNRAYDQSTGLMFAHFPQLDAKYDASGKPSNPDFDKAFHDRVLAVVKEKYSDERGRLSNSQGELLAALEVAQELGITAQAVAKAQQAGYQQGKDGKKILAPVAPGKKSGIGKSGKLSQEEYLKLSLEERAKYDKGQLGLT